MAKIFIDPGHGGNDPGATGNSLLEKNINLAVAKRVKYHLTRHNQTVLMSREEDINPTLQARTDSANKWKADLLVSIHCNAFNGNAYGIETYCYKFKYRRLADCIHARIIADKNLHNFNRGVKEGNLHMVRESSMDAALVEMAFIDNAIDATILKNKQEELAVAISKGILDYYNITWKDEGPISSPTQELYRVRKAWTDVASQKGAYSNLDNAKVECNKHTGYSVYDSKGNSVYTNSTKPPTKENIDVFTKVDGYSWVKNLEDYAGDKKTSIEKVFIYPSKGEVLFRVSPLNRDYYPWVQNYKSANGLYDFAGDGKNPIDRIQCKLKGLEGYSVRYRAFTAQDGWLSWVTSDSDYAGIPGRPILAIEVDIV